MENAVTSIQSTWDGTKKTNKRGCIQAMRGVDLVHIICSFQVSGQFIAWLFVFFLAYLFLRCVSVIFAQMELLIYWLSDWCCTQKPIPPPPIAGIFGCWLEALGWLLLPVVSSHIAMNLLPIVHHQSRYYLIAKIELVTTNCCSFTVSVAESSLMLWANIHFIKGVHRKA